MLLYYIVLKLIDGDDLEILACVDGRFDVLAATLYLAAADVIALHSLYLQLANLRFCLTSSNDSYLVNTHVKALIRTLTATQVDIDFLLLALFGSGTLDDVCLQRAVVIEPGGDVLCKGLDGFFDSFIGSRVGRKG